MEVLRLYYVGNYDNVYLTLVFNEVCKQIQHLRQSFKGHHGQFVKNSPEELFRQYMSLVPNLLDDITGSTIQLGHTFFSTLDKYIRYILADYL